MESKDEIYKLKSYLVDDFYTKTRGEQGTDRSFYDDTFPVPQVRVPGRIQRTGRASRMIDSPAEHIITSNPQAWRRPFKSDVAIHEDAATKVAAELNRWIGVMKRGNPNPPKEFVKNLLLCGESWIHPIHNELWVKGSKAEREKNRKGLPILFLLPEPMNVYADPNEDENGIPTRVIVWYQRKPAIVKARYKDWKRPPESEKEDSDLVDWLEFWTDEQIYIDADGVVLQNTKNPYGINTWIHKLSGFGKTAPDGEMADLVVGRLRKVRHLLARECAIVSDVDTILHMFADRSIDVQPIDDNHSIPPDFAEKYERGTGLIHEIPHGITITPAMKELPEPAEYQYLASVQAELEREDPLVMAGSPIAGSGRQQDMTMVSAMRRYDTIVENTEHAFSTALGMGLKICEKIPTLCPTEYGMKKKDIDGYYDVTVQLKADAPVEEDRKATLGSRLYQQGEIDLETNLTKYQGYTEAEAGDIISNILVDRVTFQSPDVAELMGMKLAEKAGLTEEMALLKQRRTETGGMGAPQQGRPSEVKTPLGREMIDEALRNRGQRSSPDGYFHR